MEAKSEPITYICRLMLSNEVSINYKYLKINKLIVSHKEKKTRNSPSFGFM